MQSRPEFRSRAPRALRFTALLLLSLPRCAAESPPLPPDAPDLVLITLDTTRADHLGTYGYFRDTSPTLDALAGESIVFERALAPMATTLPTHVSILTATAPLEHGVLANATQGGRRFAPTARLRSFAEVAQRAGYRTAAFVSAAPLKRGSGVEAGFETFDDPEAKQRDAAATTDAALAWLGRVGDERFFLWVHYYDAHYPYEPPPPFDGRFATDAALEAYIGERRIHPTAPRPLAGLVDEARSAINAYDGELRFQDEQLARLLRALESRDRWEQTAVVVVGDHGEGLCQHGLAAHGSTWHEQLHMPLLMRIPGQTPRRVGQPVSATDTLPTLLALLDVPALSLPEGQASGRNALADGQEAWAILSQDTGRERDVPYRWALTLGRWKYFRIEGEGGIREELYDLQSDPFELTDVAGSQPAVLEQLRDALLTLRGAQSARGEALRGGQPVETLPLDPAVREQLRALGYAVDDAP